MADPRKVVMHLHQEPDGWWADSPDAPGFTAVARNMEELRWRAVEGLRFYFNDPRMLLVTLFVEGQEPISMGASIVIGAPTGSAGLSHSGTFTGSIPDAPGTKGSASQPYRRHVLIET